MLHDGPVPITRSTSELNRIRAKHIAALGWSAEEGAFQRFEQRDALLQKHDTYEELHLWFEHDLFDQLQLIQILDGLSGVPAWTGRVRLIQTDRFINDLSREELHNATRSSITIGQSHLSLAIAAWSAFRQNSQDDIKSLLKKNFVSLPVLKSAIARLMEEFPSERDGLGRTERQIIDAVANGIDSPLEIFSFNQGREVARFMGDLSFYGILDRLTRGNEAPLLVDGVSHLFHQSTPPKSQEFKKRRIRLSASGKQLSSGKSFYNSPTYWIGGQQFGRR